VNTTWKSICEGCRPTASPPLRHPVRVRILEIANAREISPIAFVSGEMWPEGVSFGSRAQALSYVSYHFRELERAGCIRLVATRPCRGATEHLYRGVEDAFYSDEDFERIPEPERGALSRAGLQGLMSRADGALLAGTFDSRTNRHLSVVPMALDEQGWQEMVALMAGCLEGAMQIRREAEARLARNGEEPVWATFGMLGFESPPQPAPPVD
jgi:hypothetical protein